LLRDRPLRAALGRAAFFTAILLGLLIFRAPFLGLAVRLWLVALAAIVVWAISARWLTGWSRAESEARQLDWRRSRRSRPAEPVRALEELEHAVEFAGSTAFDFHFRLRPHLVRAATAGLERHGVELGRQPERARQLLGEEAWELVRPDRAAPERRNAPGMELGRLQRVVDRLDAL
jgi:type IV secretory pathway TrbD component